MNSIFSLDNSDAMHAKLILSLVGGYGTWLASFFGIFIDNGWQFAAITLVVLVDSFFGVVAAFVNRNFETRRALKVVAYVFTYNLLLFLCLVVEKAWPVAFFLSEAVIVPIVLFQVISIVKNLALLGLVKAAWAKEILNRIDKYKDTSVINKPLKNDVTE